MYPLTSRRWFFPAILAIALLIEAFALRATWRTDTQSDPKLRKLQVRSGYDLVLQNPASTKVQPVLSYTATKQHNHRLTVDIQSARLSDETLRLLTPIHPPNAAGRLIYAPDPSDATRSTSSCLLAFSVQLPAETAAHSRSVTIGPPSPTDIFDHAATRLLHVSSRSPLTIRLSNNSPTGVGGPGCRNLLSIGSWQQVIGKDLEISILVDPNSLVNLSLSSPTFSSGKNEVESLEIEPLRPFRLSTRPAGLSRIIQSRVYAGSPPLTLTDLRLGSDFFDVELSGKAGVPLPELLGWATWPLIALIDIPLITLSIMVFRLKKTIFVSYSWSDRDRVMPVYHRLKQAGLDVWIDHDQLRAGVDWEESIRAEMLKARRILIFLSHSLNDGGFLLTELGLARAIANDRARRSAFIIPVRLEDGPIPPILAPWNAVNLFEPDGERCLFEALGVCPPAASSVSSSAAASTS